MTMEGDEKRPGTPSDWAKSMKKFRHLSPNAYLYKISLDGVRRLDYTSELEFKDWLLLRILPVFHKREPTPTLLHGSNVGPQLANETRQYLQKQRWWSAVQSRSDEPTYWGAMAAWKKQIVTSPLQ